MSTMEEDRTGRPSANEAELVEVAAPPAGDPTMLGLPCFIFGSLALALGLVGYLPAAAAAGALPIIMMSTGLGLLITTIWSIALAQSAVACIFGIFAGFWLSYAALLLGLGHNWFGVLPKDAQRTVSSFLLVWVLGIALLTGITLRLPLAFTVLFALIDLALVLVLISNEQSSVNLAKAGGYVAFIFAGLGIYLWAGSASVATGGKPFPLGKPIAH